MAEMLRYNQGKLRLSLLPTSFIRALSHNLGGALIEETTRVLEFGAEKYSPNNWRTSGSWIKVFDSALRHAFKFACGEEYDQESGLHHLGHLGCNLAFLLEFEEQRSGVDDRYKVQVNHNKIEDLQANAFTSSVLVALLGALDGAPIKSTILVLDTYMDGLTKKGPINKTEPGTPILNTVDGFAFPKTFPAWPYGPPL
ncbi:MAG: hypothetical protein E5V72_03430 [Mesorhizobium sp.]|uniref:dATP/dGTP diphosphohydrolase domain-containing protein n=1 Tax=Mesorhizobium sp. TaxID=1871066 RepID=UPI000FE32307|nr:dATP/dGTP diphosphohydrolase domain-containing protein [Mesorhizobium sp.]RWH49592.1 MAG: hypothetical protein EOQ80_06705 [Mesorhizobium sp.]RWI74802.1 MAG: hypothetical protein EOR19_20170 [Mesorhizobium sp.]RWJ10562.1 MAG: hypothetical protein EOR24_14860 [Mesorhizobium sp.]RWJ17834.1 MAG: hypothetical protein EOR25_10735 [Mesorhizobium sp.]RWJ33295.1 MAG: hypothetical protein EOR28_11965 [Mesorhizobium sp.]